MLRELGYALLAFAAVMGVLAYFTLGLPQLSYSMIGIAVVGLTAIAIGEGPRPEPASLRLLLESLAINVEALLEELDLSGRALFLPPREGFSPVFVPAKDAQDYRSLAEALREAPLRLIGAFAGVRGAYVLLPATGVGAPDVEHAIREAVVEGPELARAVRVVIEGDRLTVEAVGSRVRRLPRFDRCLSPLPLALAAAAAAAKLLRPLVLIRSYETEEGVAADFQVL